MSSSERTQITSTTQRLAAAKMQESLDRKVVNSQRLLLKTNGVSFRGNSEVAAVKHRLMSAKLKETAALKVVSSHRTMLQMMMKNMVVAQVQLEKSRRETEEAEELSKVVERRCKMMNMVSVKSSADLGLKCPDSPRQVSAYHSIPHATDHGKAPPQLPSLSVKQEQSRLTPSHEPQLKAQLLHLKPQAKMILREVVLSAILHPKGKVDSSMLEHAMKEGSMSKQAVMNAVEVARMRLKRKQETRHERGMVRTDGVSKHVIGCAGTDFRRRDTDGATGSVRIMNTTAHNNNTNVQWSNAA